MPGGVIVPACFGAAAPTCLFCLHKLYKNYFPGRGGRGSDDARIIPCEDTDSANAPTTKESKSGTENPVVSNLNASKAECSSCRSILEEQSWDEASESALNDVTLFTETILDAPIVVISLVVENDKWNSFHYARTRLGNSSVKNSEICSWTLERERGEPSKQSRASSKRIKVIKDASADPRYANSPLVVADPYVRFYVGCPLITSDGHRIGALCLLDRHPRRISRGQQQLVINLAEIVIRQLEKSRLQRNPLANFQPTDCEPRKFSPGLSIPAQPAASPDFVAGGLREERMRVSLSEALLLVHMRTDDPHWPLLYANEKWRVLTKQDVRPPKGNVFRQKDDSWGLERCEEPAPKGFFDVLRPLDSEMLSDSEGTLAMQYKTYSSFIAGGVSFGLSAVTLVQPRVAFRIRCQPADKPLDVGAEAIRTSQNHTGGKEEANDIKKSRMYFVILVEAQECELTRPIAMTSTSGSSVESPRHVFHSNSTSRSECPVDESSSDAPLSLTGANKNDRMNALLHIKPPISPFMDVQLVKMIGSGAFAKVWYGLWIGQPVAIKVMRWTAGDNNMSAGRPVFEAALAVQLSHPNLVQTYKHNTVEAETELDDEDVELVQMGFKSMGSRHTSSKISEGSGTSKIGQDEYETWITQEWCDMGSLTEYQNCNSPMKHGGIGEVLGINMDICSALTYMHSRGIIHGDLTANNVLLVCRPAATKGFVCKVSDFGLSRVLEGDESEIMTQQLGTVSHMPPELFKTSGCSLSKPTDVWGIGVLMWQVFTGTTPFQDLSPPQVIVQVAQGLRLKMPAEAPPGYTDIFLRCNATSPDERPPVQEVLKCLLEVEVRD